MAVNPLGLVLLEDGGVPRTFTARAREDLSGGVFVFCSGAQGVVTSGAASFAYGDLLVAAHASGNQVNGVALHNVTSGNTVSVLTRGRVISACGGNILAGEAVDVDGNDAIISTVNSPAIVGRALTSAASGGFAVLDVLV